MKNTIKDYIIGIGLDVVKDRCTEEKNKIILRDRLDKFLSRQEKINERCTREEEIDFAGLCEYIRSNLIKEVELRLFGNKHERGAARNTIIAKAIEYSQAHTNLSRKRAIKITEDAIDILREFYKVKTNRELKFIAAQIEDTITEQHEHQTKEIIDAVANIVAPISETSPMSISTGMQLMREGKLNEVEDQIKNMFDALGCTHKLSPYYRFAFDMDKRHFYSQPVSKDALIHYPEKIACTGTIQINGKTIDRFDYNTVDYANRHQLPITLNVITAKKFLGDEVDPIQHEADSMVGESFIIPPKPFPKPFPCSISIDGTVFFEYVLLRTQEILDDGTIVISNVEQTDTPFRITINANLELQKATYTFKVDGGINRQLLHYLRFLKSASSGSTIIVKVLSTDEFLTKGRLDNIDYYSDSKMMDEEISFLEKVVSIEEYFNDTIEIPEQISTDDFNLISYFSDLIRGNKCTGKWTKFEFTIPITKHFRDKVLEMDDMYFSLSYVSDISISLYGKTYELSATKTFDCVKFENLTKIQKKVSVLDDGDDIRISFIPGNGEAGDWTDQIHTSD